MSRIFIVLATYNGERSLSAFLDSLLSQASFFQVTALFWLWKHKNILFPHCPQMKDFLPRVLFSIVGVPLAKTFFEKKRINPVCAILVNYKFPENTCHFVASLVSQEPKLESIYVRVSQYFGKFKNDLS